MIATLDDGRALVQNHLQETGERVVSVSQGILDQTTPNQMVVEYLATVECDSTVAEMPIVAKFYGDDSGRIAYDAMRSLHVGLRNHMPLAVPEAYFYDASLRVLAQQRVPGTPCAKLLENESGAFVAELVGSALACLHSQRDIESDVKNLSQHVQELISPHPFVLAERFPQYRPLIEAALDTFSKRDAALEFSYEPTPIHRDFQLRQLFLSEARVWLVDWDTFALGDPAFDVAYFLVYLNTHLDNHWRESVRDAFLSGYHKSRHASVTDRLVVYEAFNYLRRACRRFRIQDRGWEAEMHRMLQQLESRL